MNNFAQDHDLVLPSNFKIATTETKQAAQSIGASLQDSISVLPGISEKIPAVRIRTMQTVTYQAEVAVGMVRCQSVHTGKSCTRII